jgi:hypothetical protein
VALIIGCTGLTLRVRLLRALPPRYKVDIRIKEGAHQSENAGEPRSLFEPRLVLIPE